MQTLIDTLTPRTTLRARRAAERDPVWAVWQYDPETWRRYDTSEWRRAQRRTLIGVAVGAAWAGFWILLPGLIFPGSTFPLGATVLRWVPALIGVLTLVLAGRPYRLARRMHLARQQGPQEIRIGPLAVTEPGGPIPISGPEFSLRMVGLDMLSPPLHTLREVKIVPGDPPVVRFGGWGGRNWPTSVRVPIPVGGESAAAQVVARFRQEILDSVA